MRISRGWFLGVMAFVCLGIFPVMCVVVARGGGQTLELDLRVEDEAGVPLDDVSVEVQSITTAKGGWENRYDSQRVRIDKEGFVRGAGAAVTLVFVKDGYYPKTLDFPLIDGKEVADTLAKYGMSPIRNNIPRLRIVLEKQGVLTDLQQRGFGLSINADRSGKMWAMSLPFRVQGDEGVEVRDPKDDKQLLPYGLVATCSRDADSLMKMEGHPRDATFVMPAILKIQVSSPGDGLIKNLVQSERGIRFEHKMRQAPKEGYGETIEFVADELFKINTAELTCAFYYRCDAKFSRGSIFVKVSPDRNSINVECHLEVQPDGSRNLETGI